jgi:hypothetical protein
MSSLVLEWRIWQTEMTLGSGRRHLDLDSRKLGMDERSIASIFNFFEFFTILTFFVFVFFLF